MAISKIIGWILISLGVLILVLTFGNPLYQQLRYIERQNRKITYRLVNTVGSPATASADIVKTKNVITAGNEIAVEPVDRQFGIFIPKINANAKIYPAVDPADEKVFLPVLRKGVAHAKGTAYPGQGGNIYLFAHSTDAFFNFGRYNAVFYLIGKLKNGDEIDIYYQNKLYKYYVQEKKVVAPSAIKYIQPTNSEVLTLQTCYPPGTTLKRLIVKAIPINNK